MRRFKLGDRVFTLTGKVGKIISITTHDYAKYDKHDSRKGSYFDKAMVSFNMEGIDGQMIEDKGKEEYGLSLLFLHPDDEKEEYTIGDEVILKIKCKLQDIITDKNTMKVKFILDNQRLGTIETDIESIMKIEE